MAIIGGTAAGEFTLRNPITGVKSNADSIPTGKLVLAGVDMLVAVTIAEKETGVYSWSVPISGSYGYGNKVQVRVNAVVAGIEDNFDVCDESCDLSQSALIAAIRQGMRAADLTVQSPVIGTKISLFEAADYDEDTMLLTFSSSSWPVDLGTGEYDQVELHVMSNGEESIVGTCEVTAAGIPGMQTVEVTLTGAETAALGLSVDPSTPYKVSLTSAYTLWAIKPGSPDKKWPLSNSTLSVETTVFYEPPGP